jgi:hypothetical protein
MADGLGRMPVKAEVLAADAEIGGDGKLLTGAGTKQGAVVADAEPKRPGAEFSDEAADASDKGEFPMVGEVGGVGSKGQHFLRIGQTRD